MIQFGSVDGLAQKVGYHYYFAIMNFQLLGTFWLNALLCSENYSPVTPATSFADIVNPGLGGW